VFRNGELFGKIRLQLFEDVFKYRNLQTIPYINKSTKNKNAVLPMSNPNFLYEKNPKK